MSRFKRIPLEHAPRLINHGPTILVTSRSKDNKKHNVMTAAWSTPVEFEPPRLLVLINKESLTRKLIMESGVFAVCVPTASFVDQTYAVGSTTGQEIDKFQRFNIARIQSPELDIPVIEDGCVAWLECRLIPEKSVQEKYDTFFGEILSASADPTIFYNGRYHFTDANKSSHTIHHLGGGNFVLSNDLIAAKEL